MFGNLMGICYPKNGHYSLRVWVVFDVLHVFFFELCNSNSGMCYKASWIHTQRLPNLWLGYIGINKSTFLKMGLENRLETLKKSIFEHPPILERPKSQLMYIYRSLSISIWLLFLIRDFEYTTNPHPQTKGLALLQLRISTETRATLWVKVANSGFVIGVLGCTKPFQIHLA